MRPAPRAGARAQDRAGRRRSGRPPRRRNRRPRPPGPRRGRRARPAARSRGPAASRRRRAHPHGDGSLSRHEGQRPEDGVERRHGGQLEVSADERLGDGDRHRRDLPVDRLQHRGLARVEVGGGTVQLLECGGPLAVARRDRLGLTLPRAPVSSARRRGPRAPRRRTRRGAPAASRRRRPAFGLGDHGLQCRVPGAVRVEPPTNGLVCRSAEIRAGRVVPVEAPRRTGAALQLRGRSHRRLPWRRRCRRTPRARAPGG